MAGKRDDFPSWGNSVGDAVLIAEMLRESDRVEDTFYGEDSDQFLVWKERFVDSIFAGN